EQLSNLTFDVKLNARYHYITSKEINKLEKLIQERASQKMINDYCMNHGLSTHP
ncbi:5_t:CDS:1, partial [Gigaspora margarita]